MISDQYDVIVIGGGPAGSTTAALVAEYGHRVLLLEREEFPRFQIGESLMPGTYWSFKRLGLLDKLKKKCVCQKVQRSVFQRVGKRLCAILFSFTRSPRKFYYISGVAQ